MKFFTKYLLYLKAIVLSLLIVGCSGSGGVSPEFGSYKIALSNQMQKMIDVLFAGHNSQFMSTYVNPSYITSMGGLQQAVSQFDNTEQQRLYAELKVAKNITPFYDENVKEMVYTGAVMFKPITFKLINGKWYMQGDWFRN